MILDCCLYAAVFVLASETSEFICTFTVKKKNTWPGKWKYYTEAASTGLKTREVWFTKICSEIMSKCAKNHRHFHLPPTVCLIPAETGEPVRWSNRWSNFFPFKAKLKIPVLLCRIKDRRQRWSVMLHLSTQILKSSQIHNLQIKCRISTLSDDEGS